jgi:pimeloyl-ACP methyl ester carboxylesterase
MFRSTRYYIAVIGILSTVLARPSYGQTPGEARSQPQAKQGVEGVWVNRQITHLTSQTLVFRFAREPENKLVATLDYMEMRRHKKLEANIQKDTVQIQVAGLGAVFEAQVSTDGNALEGKIQAGSGWQPIKLVRLQEMPALRRPQEPTKPYPYYEEEVAFDNTAAGVRLAGTLTRPRDHKGRCPAIVLLSGSGPDDRNYTAGGHYPFLVLADYLTRRGLAVLRFDDRGVGQSTGAFSQATTEDLADDARAAVAYLKTREDIDPQRIGLIGHSDGALGAALLASRQPTIAVIVLLGSPGVPGDQIMLRQTELGLKALGANEHLIAWNVDLQKRLTAVLKREPDVASADKALRELYASINAELTDECRQRMGVPTSFKFLGQAGSTSWLRHFVTYDPRPTLAKVRCPVLALNGDKDLIVWSKENVPEIARALKAGGNRDHAVLEMPGLNHMFQTCEQGMPSEYLLIDETIAPAVLERVGDWIMRRIADGT